MSSNASWLGGLGRVRPVMNATSSSSSAIAATSASTPPERDGSHPGVTDLQHNNSPDGQVNALQQQEASSRNAGSFLVGDHPSSHGSSYGHDGQLRSSNQTSPRHHRAILDHTPGILGPSSVGLATVHRFGQSSQDTSAPKTPARGSVELSLKDRALAAGAAAMLSAVIMNPLDVAKTRLQAQAAGYSYNQSSANAPCNNCGSPWPDPITRRQLASYQMDWLWGSLDPRQARTALSHEVVTATAGVEVVSATAVAAAAAESAAASSASCEVACEFPAPSSKGYRGLLDVTFRIIREEGFLRLWRGTGAGMMMAVPSVGIYMPIYDTLRAKLERDAEGNPLPTAPYAPLISGSGSRLLATLLCAPLELARTRIQAANTAAVAAVGPLAGASVTGAGAGALPAGVLDTLRRAVDSDVARRGMKQGYGAHVTTWPSYRVLWRGVDAHLARDVPFSALCWSTLEPMRKFLLSVELPVVGRKAWEDDDISQSKDPSMARILGANFGAGLVAGSFAAAVTTPLDVAKTRVQIEICADKAGRSVLYHLREIWREGGMRALYTGVGPRAIKAGPSVGIIVSFYEILKALLTHRRDMS